MFKEYLYTNIYYKKCVKKKEISMHLRNNPILFICAFLFRFGKVQPQKN